MPMAMGRRIRRHPPRGLPPGLQRRIAALRADRVSGAAGMMRAAVGIGRRALTLTARWPREQRSGLLRGVARGLAGAARPMAGVQSVAALLRATARGEVSVREGRHRLEGLVSRERAAMRGLGPALGRHLAPGNGPVVTMSRSSTVLHALIGLPAGRRPRVVRVLRSLPGGEGREMAGDLQRRGLPAQLLPDGRVADALAGSRAVVVGADSILADGSLLHKVGTRRLATLARRRGIPVYVLATPSKFALAGAARRPPSDPRFDRTPARLFELVIPAGTRPTPKE